MAAYLLANAKFYIKDTITSTLGIGQTFRISGDLELGNAIETSLLSTFIVLKTGAQLERMIVTLSSGVATIIKRGVLQDGVSTSSALQKTWNDGTIGYIAPNPTDFPSTSKLDIVGGLRTGMGTAQNINATNGSTAITVADTTGWTNGATITGTGIPGGTTIVSFVTNTSAVLSANFTGTTGTVSVIVGRRQVLEIDSLHNEVKKVVSDVSSILSSDTLRKKNAAGNYEDVPYSVIKTDIASSVSASISVIAGEVIAAEKTICLEMKPVEGGTASIILGSAAGNTRVYANDIANGQAFSSVLFYGLLTGSPSDNITLRIETDNGSGKPSGTLAHANATSTILFSVFNASFYTKATATLAGSVTISTGTKIHYVFARTAAVNGANYFNILQCGETKLYRGFGNFDGTTYGSLTLTPPYIEAIGTAEYISLVGSSTGYRSNIVAINGATRAIGDTYSQAISGVDVLTGASFGSGYSFDVSGGLLSSIDSINSLLGIGTNQVQFKPLKRHMPKNQKKALTSVAIPTTPVSGFYCDKPGVLGLWVNHVSTSNSSNMVVNLNSGTDGITYGTTDLLTNVLGAGGAQTFFRTLTAGLYYQITTSGSTGVGSFRINFQSFDKI